MIIYIVLLALVALVCYSMFINRIKGLPPGPPPLPVLGNLHQFEMDLSKKFSGWKKNYGKVFTIWMPNPTVVITDHKLMQEHIIKDGDKFGDRVNPKEMMNLLVGGEYGLLFNENKMWREQRRFALHALRNVGYNSATMQDTAINYAQDIISRWKEQSAGGRPVDVTMGLMVGVANIVWQQTFGRTLPYDDPLLEKVKELTQNLLEKMKHPIITALDPFPFLCHFDGLLGSPIKAMAAVNSEILQLLEDELKLVEKHFNEDEAPKCYADAFIGEMKRREAKGEELGSYTRIQLVAACYDLWTAGFETTVTTLRTIIHFMINNPEVQRRAQREIDEKIGKRTIHMEDQKILHYCNAVIQEVQRLEGIAPLSLPRLVSEPVNIDGYDIPVGTAVIPEYSLIHLDENEYERPDFFCPERHINDKGEFVKDPRITPFSVGKRACLGEGLARMELFIYFSTYIQHLTFSSVGKVPPRLNVQIFFTRSPAPFDVLISSRN
ncbi:hypothetical protein PFISCL1PPCAC_13640 [Pristionchus fissidentatus]|uniref:Cytochrome P450 n=1 Tax=Pristionchus fissidentatus TaxID=1538716 RepID=A0AAV5VVF3_9BILA|nr:hypothetical protein PFISCL1PPCAC_13640 [Pristionchus fissidentatus]